MPDLKQQAFARHGHRQDMARWGRTEKDSKGQDGKGQDRNRNWGRNKNGHGSGNPHAYTIPGAGTGKEQQRRMESQGLREP